MDGLSGAASGIAVVSLAFQVVESISKLRDFFESIKTAPAVVATIVKDLSQLVSILDIIKADGSISNDVLATCMDKIKDLNAFTDELEPGFRSANRKTRRWTAFAAARKSSVISKFRATLEETKTTLILALQTRHLLLSRTHASHMVSMERRIRDDLAESQQHMLELIDNHRDKLSGVVQQVADQLADLSVEHKSWLVSTTSHSSSLSEHATDLSEEKARMMTKIPNPIIRQMFEAAAKAALDSHLVTMIDEEPVSQQAAWSPRREAYSPPSEVASHSGINNQLSDKWVRKMPTSPTTKESSGKRTRVRCLARSTSSVKDFFGGRIYIQTDVYCVTTRLCSNGDTPHNNHVLEHETSFTYHPAPWYLRMFLNFGVNVLFMKASQGWQYKIQTFRAVPYDSLIFDFCEKGNLDGVRTLLGRREASPWDVNPEGWTPLHMAAFSCHVEVCELLLTEGADPSVKTYRLDSTSFDRPRSAFGNACRDPYLLHRPPANRDTSRLLPTLRLLFPYLELENGLVDDALFIRDLVYHASEGSEEALKWALEACRSELKEEVFRPIVLAACDDAFFECCISALQHLSTILDIDIDAAAEPRGPSLLHVCIKLTESCPSSRYDCMSYFVEQGSDLHCVGHCMNHKPMWFAFSGPQTPTTLAMRRSGAFFYWRRALLEHGHCLDCFVIQELQNSPLASQGWIEDTLLALFLHEFEPVWESRELSPLCRRCQKPMHCLRDTQWEGALEMIKKGRISEVQDLGYGRSTDGAYSVDHAYKSTRCSEHATRPLNAAGSSGSRLPFTEQGDCLSASTDDEREDDDEYENDDDYEDSQTASLPGDERWQTICDICEMELASASQQDAIEEDGEKEEEEKDSRPRMPGGFDV